MQFLISPLKAQGLFHRLFSRHKLYVYNALLLLSEDSQGEIGERKRKYIEDQGFKVVPSILQIIGHELIQNIGTHIYGQEQGYGKI